MLQQKGLEKTMMKTNVTKINDNKKRDRINCLFKKVANSTESSVVRYILFTSANWWPES